jgi:hypothetical protein
MDICISQIRSMAEKRGWLLLGLGKAWAGKSTLMSTSKNSRVLGRVGRRQEAHHREIPGVHQLTVHRNPSGACYEQSFTRYCVSVPVAYRDQWIAMTSLRESRDQCSSTS